MGWQPYHLLVYRAQTLVAVMPSYLKRNSYGEYVFDFEWAKAYQSNGLEYYPRLVSAIPYTPATGPRICIREGEDTETLQWFFQNPIAV
jgi:predicted N-acyltransferase